MPIAYPEMCSNASESCLLKACQMLCYFESKSCAYFRKKYKYFAYREYIALD